MPEAGLNRTNMIMVVKHHKRNDRQEVSRLVRPVSHSRHPGLHPLPATPPDLGNGVRSGLLPRQAAAVLSEHYRSEVDAAIAQLAASSDQDVSG
jgi:hypothetical protein